MEEGYIMSCLMWVMGPGVPTGVTDTGPGLTLCFMSRATRPSLARMSLLRPLNRSTCSSRDQRSSNNIKF